MYKYLFLLFLFLIIVSDLKSQNDAGLVQVSGLVISEDSLKYLPYTHVVNVSKSMGTLTNLSGFFSFVAEKGDTVIFSRIGYKNALFVIPFSEEGSFFWLKDEISVIQTMKVDTILLPETIIYPWLNVLFFKEAFVKTKIPMDDIQRAKRNLAIILADVSYDNLPMDGLENQKFYIQEASGMWYYAGQNYGNLMSNNLFSPIAWAKFFEAIRNGDFKKKEKKNVPDYDK